MRTMTYSRNEVSNDGRNPPIGGAASDGDYVRSTCVDLDAVECCAGVTVPDGAVVDVDVVAAHVEPVGVEGSEIIPAV